MVEVALVLIVSNPLAPGFNSIVVTRIWEDYPALFMTVRREIV